MISPCVRKDCRNDISLANSLRSFMTFTHVSCIYTREYLATRSAIRDGARLGLSWLHFLHVSAMVWGSYRAAFGWEPKFSILVRDMALL